VGRGRVAEALSYAGALDAATALVPMSSATEIRILIENVAPHPCVNTGADFARVFKEVEDRTGVRPEMCLDPGHVHSRGGDVESFAAAVAPWTSAVHFYNTQLGSEVVGWHAPALPDQSPRHGWMDWNRLLDILQPSPQLRPIVAEHSYSEETARRWNGWSVWSSLDGSYPELLRSIAPLKAKQKITQT
jgi:sugar phosphate isomerase/epimerase